ncbi:hypothetical protein AWR36_001215 [Microbulbifer flavimaris]|uniref:Phytase-like domain-containing protein n=2 Tax=Microbulbiferaceae TaxID=1706373 RepID=A0ABX4I4H5_9GAMM|nr:hypothetical protein AWR36_001215 [Microbulbifer flavimaris]
MFGWSLVCTAETVRTAKLLGAWWLEGSAGLDISGLSFCDGELLAVSDKRDDRLYRIRLPNRPDVRTAALDIRSQFQSPEAPDHESLVNRLAALVRPGAQMDFEGVTCDADHRFVVSERHDRIARISASETGDVQLNWLPFRWREAARFQGYLQVFNAGSEGITRSGTAERPEFWIALERQPRGLLRLKGATEQAGQGADLEFRQLPPVAGLDFYGRAEDVTGLDIFRGGLYTLERNAFAVCRRSLQTLEASWCIDYRAVEEAPIFVYADTRFGKAEGLAVSENGIYVVLDNNNVARAADPSDQRALLMHLAHPDHP